MLCAGAVGTDTGGVAGGHSRAIDYPRVQSVDLKLTSGVRLPPVGLGAAAGDEQMRDAFGRRPRPARLLRRLRPSGSPASLPSGSVDPAAQSSRPRARLRSRAVTPTRRTAHARASAVVRSTSPRPPLDVPVSMLKHGPSGKVACARRVRRPPRYSARRGAPRRDARRRLTRDAAGRSVVFSCLLF